MAKKEYNLHSLLITKLKALLDTELEISETLPIMAENATDEDLKAAFERHLEETESQTARIKRCLEEFEEEADPLPSETIRGLVEDAEWMIDNVEKGPVLDSALIASAQNVEHYEMASYATAAQWAEMTGSADAAELLRKILDEEKTADAKLADIALNKVNKQAAMSMD